MSRGRNRKKKMNVQPFYHCAEQVKGDKRAIIKAIKSIKTVLKDTVDLFNGELLFTATSDVSNEANEKLKALPGVTMGDEIDAEAGDPADLL
jgi:hypothetical protein